MKKILMILPLLVLLTASVLALAFSLRADGGIVNYIGSDVNLVASKVDFSAYSKLEQGQGSLGIIARTASGDRVVLNLKLWQTNIIERNNNRLYVNNRGMGYYWKQEVTGQPKYVYLDSVRYDYNINSDTLNIAGEGHIYKFTNWNNQMTPASQGIIGESFSFRVTGMNVDNSIMIS